MERLSKIYELVVDLYSHVDPSGRETLLELEREVSQAILDEEAKETETLDLWSI